MSPVFFIILYYVYDFILNEKFPSVDRMTMITARVVTRSPVGDVSHEAERDDLDSRLHHEHGREEIVEDLQRKLQLLHIHTRTHRQTVWR